MKQDTLNPPFAQLAPLVKALPTRNGKADGSARTAATVPRTASKRPKKARTPDPLAKVGGSYLPLVVEPAGIEPATSCMPCKRSPS